MLDKVTYCGNCQCADIKGNVQVYSLGIAEGGLEVPLHHRSEEVQGEHIEKQMPPSSVHKAIAEHTVPLIPVPDIVGIELQRIGIQRPVEAKDADAGRYQYDD